MNFQQSKSPLGQDSLLFFSVLVPLWRKEISFATNQGA